MFQTSGKVSAPAAAVIAFLSLLVGAALPLRAQTTGPLTLEESFAIAQGNAPTLIAATRGAQAARELAVVAGQLPDPILRVGVDNLPVNGPDKASLTRDFMTMRRIGVMQEFVPSDKRELMRRRALLDASRMDAARRSLAATLRRDVATAWFESYYAMRSNALLKVLTTEVELQLRTLESQLRAGKATAADAPIVRAVLLQTQDRILVAEKQERVARIALARWLGKDAERDLGPAPDTATGVVDPVDPQIAMDAASVLEHAIENQISEANLAIAESSRRPNWSWELSYSQRGSAFSNMLSFGVNIPLTLNASNRQDRDVAAMQAQVKQTQALHEDLVRETQRELASVYAEWRSLLDRRGRLSDALLPLARQRIDLSMASYRSGQGNLGAVLEARRAQVEAQLQILDLERETARLWALLQYQYVSGAQP